jgi:pimeloyl-ACP methyl ester carboxylesterase
MSKQPPQRATPDKAFRRTALNHYPQSALRWVGDDGWMPQSQVLLCRRSPKQAIVFVHGWGGGSLSTWETFPQAVSTMAEAAAADAFLLDYPSTTSTVAFCASKLRSFLLDLVRRPVARIIAGSLPESVPQRKLGERYERIIIVAHSMGAVISRRALLNLDTAVDDGGLSDDELARFRLLLFAPAHCGSRIPLLIGSGLGIDFLPGAALVGAAASLWFSSLGDLDKDSEAIRKLATDNARLREERQGRGASVTHLRARVHHARNDKVVFQDDFDRDPAFEPVMRQNHRSVCKPVARYVDPLEALRGILKS